jgi:Derlin-2/3
MTSFETWFKQIPVVTRTYVSLAFLVTAACALDLMSPLNLYLNFKLVHEKMEVWRLLTNFLFFGNFGLDFLFHMFFLVRYCRYLEEGSFRNKTADFLYMVLFGATLMLMAAPFINIPFLGYSLSFMMVYVWGYRNENQQMSFLGLFNFTAPYLPWVLLGFSVLLGSSPVVDLLGIAVGHVYYFFADVYPLVTDRHLLKTPTILKYIFQEDGHVLQIDTVPMPVGQVPMHDAGFDGGAAIDAHR